MLSVLHNAFKKAIFDPRFKEELSKYDQEVDYLGPDAYAQSCREIFAQERAIVEKLGLTRTGT